MKGHKLTTIIDGSLGITFPVTAGSASAVQASSGRVLQVVQFALSPSSGFSTSSTTVVDTGLTATITPSNASNKILIRVSNAGFFNYSSGGNGVIHNIVRNSTEIVRTYSQANISGQTYAGNFLEYLDSPATTSATTYKTQAYVTGSSNTLYLNWYGTSATTSTITLMEIAA